jgi:hypothetical protein
MQVRFIVHHNLLNALVPTYRYCILILSIIGVAGMLSAQTPERVVFNHALNVTDGGNTPIHRTEFSAVSETLKVLVAMIAFQEDTEPRTSGSGSFDTTIATKKIIDPAPHDRQYVVNHMMFAENYFRKVSNGKLIVATTVLNNVYRLAQQMASYSPPRSSTNNIEVGRLMQDAWHLVDSLTPGLQFQDYNAFTIVHAGVGRDVDLSSSLGFDPTPFDIPSLYVNIGALRKMFGSSYDGIPVDGGSYMITNSIIIPETENREVNTGLGISLLQLGVNGLVVASIGSHLGLPDLFDTKTGRTGIGRFGLMDGQSIFSWNGVFPPEPSAWEKYFLGWVSPIIVPPGEAVYSLPAVGLSNEPDSVYRVPISAKEYFLVENRNRDANRDGATMTIERNGEIVQRTFYRDTTHFNAFDQDSIYGNVIDVDEFDWSLPGGVNSRTGEFFDGGLLIWHIDENIIEANYAADAVNANPDRRGVDLEEGDGSQDIGQSYGFISPGSGSEDGTALDFWYSGNPATPRLLSNEFTPNSNPSSLSNDFANSHVYIKNFSVRGPRMTAKIQLGDEAVKPLAGFPKIVKPTFGYRSVTVSGPNENPDIYFASILNIYAWNSDGTNLLPTADSSGIIATADSYCDNGFLGKVAVDDLNGTGSIDFTIVENACDFQPSVMRGWTASDGNGDGLADTLFRTTANLNTIVTSPVISDSLIALGAANGLAYIFGQDGSLLFNPQIDTSGIIGISRSQGNTFFALSKNGILRWMTPGFVPDQVTERNFSKSMNSSAVSGNFSSTINYAIALASADGSVYLIDQFLSDLAGFPVSTGGEILNSPGLADIDGDGSKDIIVFSGNKIWAINAAGSLLDHFPITTPTTKTILTSPIVADLDGNGSPDIVGVTQEGLLVAYDKTGSMVRGFPILAGINGGSTPAAFVIPQPSGCLSCPIGIGLAVASDDGHVYAWQTGSVSSMTGPGPMLPWPQYMHDAQNTGLDESTPAGSPLPTFFPESRAYNWPNPVRAVDNFKTHIRYYVASDAKVIVKIFDLAGDLVAELNGDAIGGLDNEIEWDVKSIQSGVYFAHIDAQGTGGSGSAVIKIAVVK